MSASVTQGGHNKVCFSLFIIGPLDILDIQMRNYTQKTLRS